MYRYNFIKLKLYDTINRSINPVDIEFVPSKNSDFDDINTISNGADNTLEGRQKQGKSCTF